LTASEQYLFPLSLGNKLARAKVSKSQGVAVTSSESALPSNKATKNSLKAIVLNLETATESKTTVAGEKELQQEKPIDARILQYEWKCRRRQLAEITIHGRRLILTRLVELGADLQNPETIEEVLANNTLKVSTKWHMVKAYRSYCRMFNIIWEPVKIKYEPQIPYIPTEEQAKTFINALPKTLMVLTRTLFETGCRVGEAVKIEWTDINVEACTISINHPEKGSSARINKVSRELIDLLMSLTRKHSPHVFNPSPYALSASFQRQRAKLADKWQQPAINKIHFHTFRHLRGTLDVHNHIPLFEVKTRLGHKSISNTEKYVHWNQALYHERNDLYNFAAVSTIEQAQPLIENGFEYVCEMEGMKLFRKPK
jgi:integrase